MKIFLGRDGIARVDKRKSDRSDEKLNRVYQAYRLLEAFANPLRHGMPLSTTETGTAKAAARILRGKPRDGIK